jgi:hypothetical protein
LKGAARVGNDPGSRVFLADLKGAARVGNDRGSRVFLADLKGAARVRTERGSRLFLRPATAGRAGKNASNDRHHIPLSSAHLIKALTCALMKRQPASGLPRPDRADVVLRAGGVWRRRDESKIKLS